ncbi:MAG: RagB/SusD family nutrient uptake outer membrane protein [Tannerellaceae bacterium]|nr:RagB/SusD family nutrient uptake outer membrane protein [Tannerellaceae bacterium]
MRLHIILYITACSLLLPVLTGCDDFLDTENYTMKDTSNFPQDVDDASQLLTGIYGSLNLLHMDPDDSHFFVAELASDDRFGSGGANDYTGHAIDKLLTYGENQFRSVWKRHYEGIYKANIALESFENVTNWQNEAQKNNFYGQAYFLRALFYFELSQLFGEVPLILSSDGGNFPRAKVEETYGQIAADLKNAINMLNATAFPNFESGRVTRWAAEALMARVYLFYTNYYNQSSLPLAGGGQVSKTEVQNWLEDCINNSGHGLVGDFRNLWPYTNQYTVDDYPYTKDAVGVDGNKLQWAGDGNMETVFSVKFSNVYALSAGYVNYYALYFAPPINVGENTFPFGRGWGKSCVNPALWEEWAAAEPDDIRRVASIIDVRDTDEMKEYTWGANNLMEETGYWQKKYVAITAYDPSTGNLVSGFEVLNSGATDHIQFCNTQDLVLIRFADVLLMHSELTETTTSMNKVRERAGLSPIATYTPEALMQERRFELAFEGIRWFDLMRWGKVGTALEKQLGVDIFNQSVPSTMKSFGPGYQARFEATGGFWPIPESQIDLSEGVLTQNPGWGTAESIFSGW